MTRRLPSRKGPRPIDPADAKAAVLGFANVAAGLLDVLGDLAAGETVERTVKKAVRRGRARARALRDAEEAVRGLDPDDGDG